MSFRNAVRRVSELTKVFILRPRLSLSLLFKLPYIIRGFNYAQQWRSTPTPQHPIYLFHDFQIIASSPNPLKTFFDSHETGKGVFKFIHYFDIYHHHFSKFAGKDVHILEIGVLGGGSLEMWRDYFGPKCHIYGVDIQKECKRYENEHTKIFIGDQADRSFWRSFKKNVPVIDIIIDDGGHKAEQQIITFEEMLPHLRPGGVYLCEDVIRKHNGFSAYMHGIINNLNDYEPDNSNQSINIIPTEFQAWIRSVHFYPYVTVLEKNINPVEELIALKHGTEWLPFPKIK